MSLHWHLQLLDHARRTPFGHPDFVGDGLQVRAEDVLLRKEAHTHNPGSIDHTIKPCSRTTHQLLSTPHQVVPFLTAGVVPFPSAASSPHL